MDVPFCRSRRIFQWGCDASILIGVVSRFWIGALLGKINFSACGYLWIMESSLRWQGLCIEVGLALACMRSVCNIRRARICKSVPIPFAHGNPRSIFLSQSLAWNYYYCSFVAVLRSAGSSVHAFPSSLRGCDAVGLHRCCPCVRSMEAQAL